MANLPTQNEIPLQLSKPAHRAIKDAGITSLSQLSEFTEKEFASLHGIGPNTVKQVKEALKIRELAFAKESRKR